LIQHLVLFLLLLLLLRREHDHREGEVLPQVAITVTPARTSRSFIQCNLERNAANSAILPAFVYSLELEELRVLWPTVPALVA
jgi:hypothetical protein